MTSFVLFCRYPFFSLLLHRSFPVAISSVAVFFSFPPVPPFNLESLVKLDVEVAELGREANRNGSAAFCDVLSDIIRLCCEEPFEGCCFIDVLLTNRIEESEELLAKAPCGRADVREKTAMERHACQIFLPGKEMFFFLALRL